MSEELRSILVGTLPLDLMLLAALWLTWVRGPGERSAAARRRVLLLAAPALAWQGLHFAEELATGLYERLPALFGQAPWSVGFFVAFNLAWIAIWALSLLGLRAGAHAALFPIWFLAIGCTLNGVLHPLAALATGGYFPGLWTSPVSGLLGWLLLRRLGALTAAPGA